MKHTPHVSASKRFLTLFTAFVFACFVLPGCSGEPDEEGGITGSGIILKGTASSQRALASNRVELKARSGEKESAVLASNRRFFTDDAKGDGPWVLRVNLSGGLALYGIAYDDDFNNINSYTDVILRNWFAQRSINLDTAFASTNAFEQLPLQSAFNAIGEQVFSLAKLVLESNAVSGQQLIRGDFAADDLGVDSFLVSNPVVINNGIINLFITEPTTNTQSLTRSNLSIANDLSARDAAAPSQPTSVKALGSSATEIVLVWEPSVDNVAVQGYLIWRDDELVTTTPYPVFVDSGLVSGQSYRYTVAAVDVAGNNSAPSAPTSGAPLSGIDNIAPLAPIRLTALEASSSRIELVWGQNNIADVVAFTIYRGLSTSDIRSQVTVTNSITTDNTIVGGQTYCYQVSALDASGNESPRSEILCVEAESASNNLNDNDILLYLPDIESLDCSRTLSNQDVQSSQTLSEGCYTVNENLTLAPFANLTLGAGTVLKFAAGAHLSVSQNASLTVNGDPQSPVLFTGLQNAPGFWGGIEFNRTNSPANLIRNAVVQFTGGGDLNAGIEVISSEGEKTRIRIENTVVRFSSNYGVSIVSNGTLVGGFSNNIITENRFSAAINLDLVDAVAGSSLFTGNEFDRIDVPRNNFSKPIVLANTGVILRSNGLKIIGAPLTIEAGVNMVLLGNAVIDANDEVSIQGTVESPVTMVGSVAATGSWRGLLFSGPGEKSIDHAVIQHAGFGNADTGAIDFQCDRGASAELIITNTVISDSASWGVYRGAVDCAINIANNVTFQNNAFGPINRP